MDRFGEILYDLGKEVGVDLYPDENRICQVTFDGKLMLQLLFDESKREVLIACFICEVPAGKYRVGLFEEALKTNSVYPRIGTLAYSERNNQLTLFDYVPAVGLTGEALFERLKAFINKAIEWKEAVETGKSFPGSSDKSSDPGIFGLKT